MSESRLRKTAAVVAAAAAAGGEGGATNRPQRREMTRLVPHTSPRDEEDADYDLDAELDLDADAAGETTELTELTRGSVGSKGDVKGGVTHAIMHTPLGEGLELTHPYQDEQTHHAQALPVRTRAQKDCHIATPCTARCISAKTTEAACQSCVLTRVWCVPLSLHCFSHRPVHKAPLFAMRCRTSCYWSHSVCTRCVRATYDA